MRTLPRSLAAVTVLALATAPAVAAEPKLPDLPDYKLMIDALGVWGLSPGADGADRPARGASWSATTTPIDDGRLAMRVTVVAPSVTLPVEPGPAVLFTATSLGGGFDGDVGYEELVSIDPTPLPACATDPCTFDANVMLDLRRLPRMAGRIQRLEAAWAEVSFTLVRTFGGGTWLQTLEASRDIGVIFSGTLREPAPWTGFSEPLGLFPAAGVTGWRQDREERFDVLAGIEAARLPMGDTSTPPPSTDVRLVATFVGCESSDGNRDRDRMGASIRTAAGDRITFPRAKARDFVDATIPVPSGTTWLVGWEADPAAEVRVRTTPILATATYACDDDGVRVGAVAFGEILPRGT